MTYKRRFAFAAIGMACLIAAACLILYFRPMAVITAGIRFGLWRNGASSRYTDVSVGAARYKIHYYVAGEGPAVVLVHGIASSGENWAAELPALTKAGFCVFLPDLLGFGRSEKPDVDYSIALQAEVLHSFLEQQHIERAGLGGVSMGGWVALKMATIYGTQVNRLLLVDSAGTEFAPSFDRTLFEPKTVPELQRLINQLTPHAPRLPEFLGNDMLRTAAPGGWVIHRAMDSMFSRRDLMNEQLQSLRMPTLILWGKADRLIPMSNARFLNQQIIHSELKTFAGCGHWLIEMCGEQITPSMIQFFRSDARK